MMYDCLRRKEVPSTPEEEVRQWFIGQLHSCAGVPLHMMMSEVSFKYGKKPYRADIVVYDRSCAPLAVVECKRPGVSIDSEVMLQALRYDMVLGVDWIIVTNGHSTYVFRKNGDRYNSFGSVPTYEKMLCGRQTKI